MTSFKHSGSEGDIEIIRQVYSGINRNDIDFVLNLMDVGITRIEPEGFPAAGTYTGHTDLRQHLINGRSTWAEGTCEPVDFFANGNKIVVTVHIKVRLKNKSEWADARIADGFMIKDSRVLEFHSFANNQKAFEWAGIAANH
ncbi:nuclear transport factor 2 family protein [Mucilaginibacter sp. UR6-11]|uniref:nuclear transport factor 2 family protein n=1 Tax=Mucilaginibacter sp. UR6-11 TaxID=1435644 RepID=UPI001E543256|nr:nuclear transport factor 2 family protein [Mucilaginibacter sp. UR6-11]MCC8425349.1 nuclear transport factor 2 family protein [Mucilaginibacter sp. UR6-11]